MSSLTSFLPGQKTGRILKLATANLCLFSSIAFASSVFEDLGMWLQDATNRVKTIQSNRPEDLNRLIAGQWADKVQIVVSDAYAKKGAPDRYAYSSIGTIAGTIDSLGKMVFQMENGCIFQGEVLSFASDNTWSIDGFLDHCPVKTLNRKLIGRLVNKQQRVFFALNEPMITQSPSVKISIRTTLLARF